MIEDNNTKLIIQLTSNTHAVNNIRENQIWLYFTIQTNHAASLVSSTGRKKSRFKQLKTRLFGKLKKKESEGLIKQSQSASDITAPEGRRDGYDSEDEFS